LRLRDEEGVADGRWIDEERPCFGRERQKEDSRDAER
jgi:hypothetical protein